MVGKIKTIVSDRKFGFIRVQDGTEYFFHKSDLDSSLDFDELEVGVQVEFDTVPQSGRGPRAARVKLFK